MLRDARKLIFMKISIFIYNINNLVGGAENATMNLSSMLLKAGHDVELVTYDRRSGEPFFVVDPSPIIRNLFGVTSLPSSRKSDTRITLKIGEKFTTFRKRLQIRWPKLRQISVRRRKTKVAVLIDNYLVSRKPDIIISVMPGMTITLSQCKNASGIPKIFVCHTEPVRDFGIGSQCVREQIAGLNLIDALNDFDTCVVLSEQFKRQISNYSSLKVVAIPNSLGEVSLPEVKSLPVLQRKPIIVFVGRFESVKRIELLLQAWKIVTAKIPEWSLHLYGDGSLRANLQKFIEKNQLSSSCRLMGISNNVNAIFAGARLSILPSEYEGLPVSMIESMSCGTPGIGIGDCKGTTDLLHDCGFICPTPNPNALAKSILNAVNSPKELAKYSNLSVKKSECYKSSNVSKLWQELIFELHEKNN